MLRLIGLLVVVAGIALGGHWLSVQGMQAPGEVGRLAARSCAACHRSHAPGCRAARACA